MGFAHAVQFVRNQPVDLVPSDLNEGVPSAHHARCSGTTVKPALAHYRCRDTHGAFKDVHNTWTDW
ncbi:MAG: hypothetical protein AAFO75_07420, partial [Pseudomonadota bacterium]